MTATAAPDVRELAAKSAAELRRRGWYQGDFVEIPELDAALENCSVCAVGAIMAAEGVKELYSAEPDSDLSKVGHALVYTIAARVDPLANEDTPQSSVYEWNDNRAKSSAEVLAVFDAIAKGE